MEESRRSLLERLHSRFTSPLPSALLQAPLLRRAKIALLGNDYGSTEERGFAQEVATTSGTDSRILDWDEIVLHSPSWFDLRDRGMPGLSLERTATSPRY